jgi:hypothetical protein
VIRQFEYTPILKPHAGQIKVLQSRARFKVIKAGRRFGKTKVGLHWLIGIAIQSPGELVYYVAPTYRMAKEIAWKELFDQLPDELIIKKDERELWVDIVTTGGEPCRIALKGSDDQDHLRGRRLAALLMDEAAFQKPEVYNRILRPMLADLCAPAMFISSPKPGWFSQLFKVAEDCKDGSMQAWHFTIYDNPTIKRAEIEQVKKTTSDHIWRSEYMAEDVEYSGQVYMEFTDSNIYSPHEFSGVEKYPVAVGIDWGSDDPTGVAWLHFSPEGHAFVDAEHQKAGWDTGRHSEIIRNLGRTKVIDNANYVLSFDAFSHRAKDHNSIAEDFRGHLGFLPQVSSKDFSSGVDIVKRYLRGDGENPWLRVSSNCPETIGAFQSWEWNDHEPDIIAAVRYALVHAIKRGLTRLADIKKVRYHFDAVEEAGPRLPKIRSRGARWDFDSDHGAPSLGWA